MLPPGPLLVQLPNWLGDAVVATGLLGGLARALPGRDIDLFGNAVSLAVATGHPGIRRLLPLGGVERSFWARWRAALPLRRSHYAASLTLSPSWTAAFIARQIGARRRVGFAGPGRAVCFSHQVQRPVRGSEHLLEEYERLAAALGVAAGGVEPQVVVAPAARERAQALTGAEGYLAVAPAAIYGPAKRWGVDRFAEAAGRLVADRDWRVVVVGGPGDRQVCAELGSRLGVAAIDLSGRTTIAELAAVLAGASLVLANDSGPMHLAAAVGAPVVGIFGSTEPAWTAPVGGAVARCEPPPPCAPCYRRTCDEGYVCLERLEAGRVVEIANGLLARRGRPGRVDDV